MSKTHPTGLTGNPGLRKKSIDVAILLCAQPQSTRMAILPGWLEYGVQALGSRAQCGRRLVGSMIFLNSTEGLKVTVSNVIA